MSNNNVTRGDLPLSDDDRKGVEDFKKEVKESRPDRYGQKDKDKEKKD